jgi:signal peptidase I
MRQTDGPRRWFWWTVLVLSVAGCGRYRNVSPGMEPTLLVGDRFQVDRHAYDPAAGRVPRPGDVITFALPHDRSKKFAKRVIATAGQTVELRNNRVYVDGRMTGDVRAHPAAGSQDKSEDFGPYTVPPDHVFVMGDNRSKSYDSRHYGAIPLAVVEGRVSKITSSRSDDGMRWERVGVAVE